MNIFDLEQYSPSDWGAQVDYDQWPTADATSQIFIHWGGGPVREAANGGNINSEKAVLRSYESYHLSKGWRGSAYDWAVGQSGTLYRVRGMGRSAATSGDVDSDRISNNREGEAILCILGEGQSPSSAMMNTLVNAIEALGHEELFTHNEASSTGTACPGPELTHFVEQYRNGNYVIEDDVPSDEVELAPAQTIEKNWTEQIVSELGTHRRGDPRSPRVRRLQVLLNLSGLSALKPDGVYGPKTEAAVTEYQNHFKLVVDGIAGKNTWRHLLLNERY